MYAPGLTLTAAARQNRIWSPARLFGSSDKGTLLNIVPGLLCQDSNGNTPVTASGQPVGLVRTAAGSIDVVQATSAARPTLGQDGAGRWYLGLDGVDDCLTSKTINWGTDEVTVIVAASLAAGAANAILLETSASSGSNAGTMALIWPQANGNTVGLWRAKGSGTSVDQLFGSLGAEMPRILSCQADLSEPMSRAKGNGNAWTSSVTSSGAINFGNWPLFIGMRNGTSQPFAGRIYGLLVINRILNPTELAMTERWMAARCGVTLP